MTKYLYIIRIFQIVIAWYEESSKDKVITDDEIADLIARIAKVTEYKIKL